MNFTSLSRIVEMFRTTPPAPANAQPVAWSGWACQYTGKMPRLYGDKAIAEINCDYSNGDQLLFLSSAPPAPAVQSVVDWRLDESTGAKILMYKDCSVIEDQQAEYVLSLIQAAAPGGGNG